MLYCKNCKRLTDDPVCPRCRSTKLRVALDGDFCEVAELPYVQAEMLKELYSDEQIPCIEQSVLGAAITVNLGINISRVRLYVPYAVFGHAAELKDAFFGGNPVLIEEPGLEEAQRFDPETGPEDAPGM